MTLENCLLDVYFFVKESTDMKYLSSKSGPWIYTFIKMSGE